MEKMENFNSVCYVARINEIKPIPGADNIEQAVVGGWNAIIQKGQYAEGGLVVVTTTDAVIPQELSDAINVTNYLRKGQRVRTVKLRGVYSECLIMPLSLLVGRSKVIKTAKEGDDMMENLGVYKYEPPIKQITLSSGKRIRFTENEAFRVYYKFPNVKNVPGIFTEEDNVQITRKLHGTNARYGIVKKTKLSFWDKIKKFFRLADKWIHYEFAVGSHNVEKGSDSQGYYDTNVWYEVADKYKIKEKLWNYIKVLDSVGDAPDNGIVIYGEIYGPGIQKNYDYGLKELEFAVFDITYNNKYDSVIHTEYVTKNVLRLPHVPILYIGPWSQKVQDKHVFNNMIEGTKVPHEGIVIKHVSGERQKVAKVINPDYLIASEKHDYGDSH
jgi:RNA ligase (TIGR02306 family)